MSQRSTYTLDNPNIALKAILGFHAFTGCGTVSTFCGKGKIKPPKVLLKNQTYMVTFASIVQTSDLTDEKLDVLQEFACDMYGHKGSSTNDLRYKLYSSKQGKLKAKSIPPCLDSLELHSKKQRSKHLFGVNALFNSQ